MKTERLRVRPLSEADRHEFLRVRTTSEEFFRPWFPILEESFEEIFEQELQKNLEDGRHFRWVGELPDGRLAGFFNLNNIVRGVFQNAYASWSVSADVGSQGYGTEGVRAMLDFAFSEAEGLGLHRVQANIIPGNERSLRLARRVGFRKEGRAKRYVRIAGEWQDHWMYAKTVEEHSLTYLS